MRRTRRVLHVQHNHRLSRSSCNGDEVAGSWARRPARRAGRGPPGTVRTRAERPLRVGGGRSRCRWRRRTARWARLAVGRSGTVPLGWAENAALGARPQGKRRESADKPGSVEDNHPSGARVAACLERPTRKPLRAAGTGPKARALPYLVLLQVGFAVPPSVATGAVRSYRTLSPLPSPHRCGAWAVCSLLHFPWAHAPQALPGTLPCGARTFLHAPKDAAVAWPTPGASIRDRPLRTGVRG